MRKLECVLLRASFIFQTEPQLDTISTFQMEPQWEVLFSSLAPTDQVSLAVCNSVTFAKCPVSKLYFKTLRHGRVRRMILPWMNCADVEKYQILTHLQLFPDSYNIADFHDFTNLRFLKVDQFITDVVLPPCLQTFIGTNIMGSLAIPQSLTHLRLSKGSVHTFKGVEEHPNLTILRFPSLILPDNFKLPPNLVILEMSNSWVQFPETLRILRVHLSRDPILETCLPPQLEELHLHEVFLSSMAKLPRGLRILSLPSFDGIIGSQVDECPALTTIRLNPKHLDDRVMRRSLEFVHRYIPQVIDLGFRTKHASNSLTGLSFTHLKRLIIATYQNLEPTLKLGHLETVVLLKIRCLFSKKPCTIELPPHLEGLQLTRTKYPACYQFSLTLPVSLKELQVDVFDNVFSIFVSREHLPRLKIVGDRGASEQDGGISTIWGQFVFVD